MLTIQSGGGGRLAFYQETQSKLSQSLQDTGKQGNAHMSSEALKPLYSLSHLSTHKTKLFLEPDTEGGARHKRL